MNFSVGDVVELKSGGPRMTIEHVGTELKCVWFDRQQSHDMKSRLFPAGTLKKVESSVD